MMAACVACCSCLTFAVKTTQVSGRGYTEPGEGGRIDVQLEQVNPADLAGFSSLFSPLSALSLPVDAELGFELGPTARLRVARSTFD